MLENAQVTASTTGPLSPEMYGVTQTMGAPLCTRCVETGKVKAVRNENWKLRPRAIAVIDEEGRGGRRGATLPLYGPTQQRAVRMPQFSRETKKSR